MRLGPSGKPRRQREIRRNEEVLKSQSECSIARAIESQNRLTSKLTAGEKRVLTLLSFAKTNKEIACGLGISPATVKRHLENVLRKLELRNRVEAAICGLIADGCPCDSNPACPLAAWLKRMGCAETIRPVCPIDGSGMRKPHFGKFGAISSIFLMGLIAAWKRFVKRKLEGCCENGRIDQERGDKYAVLNQPLASTQATEVSINTARKINPKMAPSRQ
jgi:DNA-binding CsgD family transcriptional regulator